MVGSTFQQLEHASPRTYIGSGKALEVEGAVSELEVDTVIFDDELTPGQLRNLERAWGDEVRLCDRTALILYIFSQRAATREGQLQVGFTLGWQHVMHAQAMWHAGLTLKQGFVFDRFYFSGPDILNNPLGCQVCLKGCM